MAKAFPLACPIPLKLLAAMATVVALGAGLAGCSSQGAREQTRPSGPAGESKVDAAYREMFESTVPSIEAALPLAMRVDSSLVMDTRVFTARAWFSGGQAACMKVFQIERGDTTSADSYYYEKGRLVAWVSTMHRPEDPPGRRGGVVRALIGPDGRARRTDFIVGGVLMPPNPRLTPDVVRFMTAELDTGLRAMLTRKASRMATSL
jgi:hypothetical protein